MKKSVVWLLLFLVASNAYAAPAPKPMQVCIGSNGNMMAKAKCAKGEVKGNSFYFQPRLNGYCRVVTATSFTTNGVAGLNLTCDPSNEVLLTYGYDIDPIQLTSPRNAVLLTGDNGRVIGVRLAVQQDYPSTATPFTLIANGVCCYS